MLCILILIPEYENCIIVHLGCKDVPYPLDSGVRMRETIALDVCHSVLCHFVVIVNLIARFSGVAPETEERPKIQSFANN